MTKTIYESRTQAIQCEIIEPIEANGTDVASRNEFDIDLIAENVLTYDSVNGREGFRVGVTDERFWEIVANCAVSNSEEITVTVTCDRCNDCPVYTDTTTLAALSLLGEYGCNIEYTGRTARVFYRYPMPFADLMRGVRAELADVAL